MAYQGSGAGILVENCGKTPIEAGFLYQRPHALCDEAKERLGEWLNGYQVVLAQVVGSYGDGKLAHPLANAKQLAKCLVPESR